MIELCIDARMAFSSGIGTCIREIAPFFNSPPFKTVLLVDREGQKWCAAFDQIVFSSPIYSFQEQISYPRKIPRCDLFWSPHYNVPLLPVRAKKKIATIHDACHLALADRLSYPEKLYARFTMRKALHGSHATVTDSDFSKKELVRFLGFPKKELKVIHPAVDRKKFQRSQNQQAMNEVKIRYALPEKFILFVGNLKPHKNLAGLINAFQSLSLGPEWGVVAIGKKTGLRNGSELTDLRSVLILEDVSDAELPFFYEMAQMLVFPSFYEGFGLPPLEAMSCGCPVIVSQAASLPEVCKDAAFYIDPASPSAIGNAILKVAADSKLREEFIQKGFARSKEFDWAQTGTFYRQFFEKVHYA